VLYQEFFLGAARLKRLRIRKVEFSYSFCLTFQTSKPHCHEEERGKGISLPHLFEFLSLQKTV